MQALSMMVMDSYPLWNSKPKINPSLYQNKQSGDLCFLFGSLLTIYNHLKKTGKSFSVRRWGEHLARNHVLSQGFRLGFPQTLVRSV